MRGIKTIIGISESENKMEKGGEIFALQLCIF
jgi:hypothetical protein